MYNRQTPRLYFNALSPAQHSAHLAFFSGVACMDDSDVEFEGVWEEVLPHDATVAADTGDITISLTGGCPVKCPQGNQPAN